MFISFGEIIVIILVTMIVLKPCEIVPIMQRIGEIVGGLIVKISSIISYIKHYFK